MRPQNVDFTEGEKPKFRPADVVEFEDNLHLVIEVKISEPDHAGNIYYMYYYKYLNRENVGVSVFWQTSTVEKEGKLVSHLSESEFVLELLG